MKMLEWRGRREGTREGERGREGESGARRVKRVRRVRITGRHGLTGSSPRGPVDIFTVTMNEATLLAVSVLSS